MKNEEFDLELTEEEEAAYQTLLEYVRNGSQEFAVEVITKLAEAMGSKVLEMTGDPKEDVRRLRETVHTMPTEAVFRAIKNIKDEHAELLIYDDMRH